MTTQLKTPGGHFTGYIPSPYDINNIEAFPDKVLIPTGLPESFSLREECAQVALPYSQNTNDCTANAVAFLLQFDKWLNGVDMGTPSRRFIYYLERLREHDVLRDEGAIGHDGFKVLRHTGAPPETFWPYDKPVTIKPDTDAYAHAGSYKIQTYVHPGPNGREIMALIANKQPVACGATLYESFEGAEAMRTGYVPMPVKGESIIGGHEFDFIGWTPTHVECRNSWGPDVQDEGYFWLPWEYVLSPLCGDFRAISREDS
jgi:C1A family cysteine protease